MAGRKQNSASGFTLIEVMVVLGIIAAITALIIPRINNQNNQIKAAVRRIGTLAKEMHTHARLYGATYRLVIDFGSGNNRDEEDQFYWVEKSTQPYLLPEDKETILEPPEEENDEEEKKPRAFELDSRLTPQKKSLPGDLRFKSVEVIGLNRPIESGRAYIHFFPQGLVEEAVIQLGIGEDLNWSVALHPLTGKADIVTKKISLREIKNQ